MRAGNADYWQFSACHEYERTRGLFSGAMPMQRNNTVRAQSWRADDRCDKWRSVMNIELARAKGKAGGRGTAA
jgi:hypothetical protein